MLRIVSVAFSLIFALLLWADIAHADPAGTFTLKCKGCHGADGKGNPAMAAALKTDPAAMNLTGKGGDCEKTLTEGKGKMPKMPDAKEACEFVKTLK